MRAAIHNVNQAAAQGDAVAVARLVAGDRALANVTGEDGLAPLHHAVRGGHFEVARFLLERGANANLRVATTAESTPLYEAAAAGHAALVALLLEHGAKINARARSGKTALHRAAETGDLATVQVLLEGGADIGVKDEHGLTPFELASSAGFEEIAARLRSGA